MLSMLPKLDENDFCNRYILAPKSLVNGGPVLALIIIV